jgi:hypothetical protein
MRKIWFLTMFTLIATSSVFGDYFEKLYIDLDRVIFDYSGIWVESEGSFFEVDGILFDKLENKYYTVKNKPKWKCGNPECGKYNDPKRDNCWYCGWPWGLQDPMTKVLNNIPLWT